MIFIVLIPILFAIRDWRRRQRYCQLCSRMLIDLAEVRHLVRSSVLLPVREVTSGIFAVADETTGRGLSIGSSLSRGMLWMRMILGQAQKLGKLSGLWLFRMSALVLLALSTRFYLVDDPITALSGANMTDRLLILSGSCILLVCSGLFFRVVPDLSFDDDGVLAGMSAWLRSRIATENGEGEPGWSEIQEFDADERSSGISRAEDKADRLDSFWQRQVQQLESAGERALDLMPVAEFSGFGIFVLCLIGEPIMQLGLFN